jgi:chromosome segregation ATPase
MPGKYSVAMAMRVNGVVTAMPGSQTFNVIVEGRENMTAADRTALADFQKKISTLQRSVLGANDAATSAKTRITLLKRAANEAPVENKSFIDQANAFDDEIDAIINALRGGRENTEIPPPSILQRVGNVAGTIRLSSIRPTQSQLINYELASSEFAPVLARLRTLIETDLPRFEKALEAAGAPLTPGRLPN